MVCKEGRQGWGLCDKQSYILMQMCKLVQAGAVSKRMKAAFVPV